MAKRTVANREALVRQPTQTNTTATVAQADHNKTNAKGRKEEIAANTFYTPELMRKNNVIGQAQEVIDRLKAYEAMGYNEYSFWIDTGMSFERKKASLQRMINEVMPAFA